MIGLPVSETKPGSAGELTLPLNPAAGGLPQPRPRSLAEKILGWVAWLASVFACAILLVHFTAPTRSFPAPEAPDASYNETQMLVGRSEAPSLKLAMTKRDACAAPEGEESEFNLTFRIASVFIVMAVSGGACAFPVVAMRFPSLRIPANFFFTARHFGTGVLIATAFVHLLPTAFGSLSDPCLPAFWTEDYPAMPGAISLAAVFFITIIEMVFHPGASCVAAPTSADNRRSRISTRGNAGNRHSYLSGIQPPPVDSREAALSKLEYDDQSTITSEHGMSDEAKEKKDRLGVVLLEMGILFHSVFIGMALAVSPETEFIILLIAICFHQTFEGLALGSRIVAVRWTSGKGYQPWLMALAYGSTTPIGQCIGLATRSLYSPDSTVGLLMVGIMNAISGGLLIFASLVELLSEDFLSDESWKIMAGGKRIFACCMVFFGAFMMSLVGAWA